MMACGGGGEQLSEEAMRNPELAFDMKERAKALEEA
jgi:hypothetical protein